MSKKVTTILTVLLALLMIASAVLAVLFGVYLGDADTPEGIKMVDLGLTWTYVLLIAATAITLLFSIRNLFLDGKKAIYSVASFVVLAVIFMIGWGMGSDTLPVFHNSDKLVTEGILTPSIAHTTDMLLYTRMILMAIAVIAITIVPPVLKLTRRN